MCSKQCLQLSSNGPAIQLPQLPHHLDGRLSHNVHSLLLYIWLVTLRGSTFINLLSLNINSIIEVPIYSFLKVCAQNLAKSSIITALICFWIRLRIIVESEAEAMQKINTCVVNWDHQFSWTRKRTITTVERNINLWFFHNLLSHLQAIPWNSCPMPVLPNPHKIPCYHALDKHILESIAPNLIFRILHSDGSTTFMPWNSYQRLFFCSKLLLVEQTSLKFSPCDFFSSSTCFSPSTVKF